MPASYFLKFDKTEYAGDSTVDEHVGEVEVLSWAWGLSHPAQTLTVERSGGTKPSFLDFGFSIKTAKVSPQLFFACAAGSEVGTVNLFGVSLDASNKPVPSPFLTIKFSNVKVSGFKAGGATGNVPSDEVSITFSKADVTYSPEGKAPSGPVEHWWDLDASKGG